VVIPLSAAAQLSERRTSAGANTVWTEKNPFATLFTTPDQQKLATQKKAPRLDMGLSGGASTAAPRVVCGMTIHQANPDVDPKILQKPRGGDVDYKLRSMTSTLCR
jgi:hypothetical protein